MHLLGELASGLAVAQRAGAGGLFGPGGGLPDMADFDPSQLDLPAGFEKYLKDR